MLTTKKRTEIAILCGKDGYNQRDVAAECLETLSFIESRTRIKTIRARKFKMNAILLK